METRTDTLDDGRLQITLIVTEEELTTEIEVLSRLEQALPDETEHKNAASSDEAPLVRRTYCCTCGDGQRRNIRASSGFSAALKCAERCKGPFSTSRGDC